jgi:hypothetical protein
VEALELTTKRPEPERAAMSLKIERAKLMTETRKPERMGWV